MREIKKENDSNSLNESIFGFGCDKPGTTIAQTADTVILDPGIETSPMREAKKESDSNKDSLNDIILGLVCDKPGTTIAQTADTVILDPGIETPPSRDTVRRRVYQLKDAGLLSLRQELVIHPTEKGSQNRGRCDRPPEGGRLRSTAMDSVVSASINAFPDPSSNDEIVSTHSKTIVAWGTLDSIVQLDEDFIGLSIKGKVLEAPARLLTEFRGLVGQNISIFLQENEWQWRRVPA